MRKLPAEFLRQRLQSRSRRGLLLFGIAMGLLAGAVITVAHATVTWIAFDAAIAMAALALFFVASAWFGLVLGRWRLKNIKLGVRGEVRVGQAIEKALVSGGCALAHSVARLRTEGDIDHLVATPGKLWVVETKFARLRKRNFAKALRRVGKNAQRVSVWGGPRVSVQACLVIAYGPVACKRYDTEYGPVVTYSPLQLARELRQATTASVSLQSHDEVADRVWDLAKS